MSAAQGPLAALLALAQRLRTGSDGPSTLGLPPEVLALYQEMLHDNFAVALGDAFPMTSRHLGTEFWQAALSAFIAEVYCATPCFHEIPEEFLGFFLNTWTAQNSLPPYLSALAHWEWVQWMVNLAPGEDPGSISPLPSPSAFWACRLRLAPARQLLTYPYPVHALADPDSPVPAQSTYLCVYKDVEDGIRTRALVPGEARLLAACAGDVLTGKQAYEQSLVQQPDLPAEWAERWYRQWWEIGLLWGVYPPED